MKSNKIELAIWDKTDTKVYKSIFVHLTNHINFEMNRFICSRCRHLIKGKIEHTLAGSIYVSLNKIFKTKIYGIRNN